MYLNGKKFNAYCIELGIRGIGISDPPNSPAIVDITAADPLGD